METRLRDAGIEAWRLEAKWMREDAPDEAALAAWIERRVSGEPLQYIEGFAYFWGRKFFADERALIPRPDTEILLEEALKKIRPGMRVLDLCAGSGILGITLALEEPGANVALADISESALALAQKNARALGADVEFFRSDLFQNLSGEFDLIVCNPPYLTQYDMASLQPEVTREPALALYGGSDGLDFYRRIARELDSRLRGAALFEVGLGQAEAVNKIFGGNCGIARDLAGIDRVVIAERN